MSEIRSQATPARDELAEKVFDLLVTAESMGEQRRNVIAHGIAMGLEDAGWSKPRIVNTAAELDALPVGAVVHSAAGTIAAKLDRTEGVVFGIHRSFQWSGLALPATVLFTPGEAG